MCSRKVRLHACRASGATGKLTGDAPRPRASRSRTCAASSAAPQALTMRASHTPADAHSAALRPRPQLAYRPRSRNRKGLIADRGKVGKTQMIVMAGTQKQARLRTNSTPSLHRNPTAVLHRQRRTCAAHKSRREVRHSQCGVLRAPPRRPGHRCSSARRCSCARATMHGTVSATGNVQGPQCLGGAALTVVYRLLRVLRLEHLAIGRICGHGVVVLHEGWI